MRQEVTRAHSHKGWALDGVALHNDVTKMTKEDITAPPPSDIGILFIVQMTILVCQELVSSGKLTFEMDH